MGSFSSPTFQELVVMVTLATNAVVYCKSSYHSLLRPGYFVRQYIRLEPPNNHIFKKLAVFFDSDHQPEANREMFKVIKKLNRENFEMFVRYVGGLHFAMALVALFVLFRRLRNLSIFHRFLKFLNAIGFGKLFSQKSSSSSMSGSNVHTLGSSSSTSFKIGSEGNGISGTSTLIKDISSPLDGSSSSSTASKLSSSVSSSSSWLLAQTYYPTHTISLTEILASFSSASWVQFFVLATAHYRSRVRNRMFWVVTIPCLFLSLLNSASLYIMYDQQKRSQKQQLLTAQQNRIQPFRVKRPKIISD